MDNQELFLSAAAKILSVNHYARVERSLQEIKYMGLFIVICTAAVGKNDTNLELLKLCEQFGIRTEIILKFGPGFTITFQNYLQQLIPLLQTSKHAVSLAIVYHYNFWQPFWGDCRYELAKLLEVATKSTTLTGLAYNGAPKLSFQQMLKYLPGSHITKLQIFNSPLPLPMILNIMTTAYPLPLRELFLSDFSVPPLVSVASSSSDTPSDDSYVLGQKLGQLVQAHPTAKLISLSMAEVGPSFASGFYEAISIYPAVIEKKVKLILQEVNIENLQLFWSAVKRSKNIKYLSLSHDLMDAAVINKEVLDQLAQSNLQKLSFNHLEWQRFGDHFEPCHID